LAAPRVQSQQLRSCSPNGAPSDNAKKLGGQTAAQIAAQGAKAAVALSPAGAREASTAASLVTIKTASSSIAADDAAP
jgi:hypothetical protein